MEWMQLMKHSIAYLEDHLDKSLDMNEAARVACSSKFHFQRMFHMLTGVTVAEYVRRRKLTLAAQDLASSKTKVVDIALKYGYETPESFAKAFQRLHGLTPTAARSNGVNLKASPRLSFHISLTGDKDMNYKMIDKDAFEVVGKSIKVTTREGENQRAIPKFWGESHESGLVKKLEAMTSQDSVYGICKEFHAEEEEFAYMIAVDKPSGEYHSDLEVSTIPAASWAVFESVGPMPHAIQKVWNRIYTEWFPATGYEQADAPQLEVYPILSVPYDAENYRCEVWIPVIKK